MSKLASSLAGYAFETAIVQSFYQQYISDKTMERHAKKALRTFNKFLKVDRLEHIGNSVNSQLGDILVNNSRSLELKYVDQNSGTYHNTSLYYFSMRFPTIIPYNQFLEQNGYFAYAQSVLPSVKWSSTKNSPTTNKMSSFIRHHEQEAYNLLAEKEKAIRDSYLAYLCNTLTLEDWKIALSDFINKVKPSPKQMRYKGIPDYLLVFNKKQEEVEITDKNQLMDCIRDLQSVRIAGSSLLFNDSIRAVLGWQNGTGLNNPTIRIFIDKKGLEDDKQ